MRHRLSALLVAFTMALAIAAPVTAAQRSPLPACEVVQSLPVDLIGHLFSVNPPAAERLLALLAETCPAG